MKTDIILRDYQFEPYNFLNSDFEKLVLAMCPSSGKTETVIYYINELIKKDKDLKVLILPHSTNVLLNNFYDRLEQRNVCFSYSTDTSHNTNVHVILPQSTSKINGKYDIIIIDEAHENYFAKTVQNIIKKTSCKKQILLTGTPYKFIGRDDFKFHFLALNELDKNTIPKLRVDIIESYYDWNGNYNYNNEIKKEFDFNDSDTQKSIEKTFKFIVDRNGNNSISKTLIVCNNIKQSKSVKKYLDSIGLLSVISNSENDKNSELVQDFKNNKINILIVVNRARLGYDDTDLINLIDMSGTLNPNLIYQMMARVLRGYNNTQKYYIRLTSKTDNLLNSEISTSLALMLTDKKYISTFNGKDFSSKKIIIPNYFSKESISSNTKKGFSSKLLKETDDIISFYRDTLIDIEKNAGVYKFCEIKDVLIKLGIKNTDNIKYTLDDCKKSALKYKTRSEWEKKDKVLYSLAYRRKWLDECCVHMKSLKNTYTLDDCKKSASKYETKKEWRKEARKLYDYAKRYKWHNECCGHMEALKESHTLNDCKKSASKYTSRKEWENKDNKLYRCAYRRKWLDECCVHMKSLKNTYTLDDCKKSALKYKTRSEWAKKDNKLYQFAKRYKWHNECCEHMKPLAKHYTLDDCKKSASKYTSKKEWENKDRKLYVFAVRRKWHNECCEHMEDLNKHHTLDDCKKSASKYTSRKEWKNKDNKLYQCAYKRKWLDECCVHMKFLIKFRTLDDCKKIASKYKTKGEWLKKDIKSYRCAKRNEWFDECCEHMIKK